jgi:large subunit ribosomal protein L19
MNAAMNEIEKPYLKTKTPKFAIGDTVDVHIKIREGDRERVQVFTGTVIARRGSGTRETFTVRRVVAGEGVERVFPLHSPIVTSVKIKRKGKVRRAKLYYLRERVGKATKVKELIAEVGDKKKSRTKKRGRKAKQARKEAASAAKAKGKEQPPTDKDVEKEKAEEEVATAEE